MNKMSVCEFRKMLEHPEKLPVTQYPELPLPKAGMWAEAVNGDYVYFPHTPEEDSVKTHNDNNMLSWWWDIVKYTDIVRLRPKYNTDDIVGWEPVDICPGERIFVEKVWQNMNNGGFHRWWLNLQRCNRITPIWINPHVAAIHVKLSDLRRLYDGPVIVDKD